MRISIDTRTIKRGDTFLAIKGRRFDGHDFVREALRKGAKKAVVSKIPHLPPAYRPRLIKVSNTLEVLAEMAGARRAKFGIPLIAVTGSNGKTTAKDMLARVLSSRYNVLKNETSKNNFIGLSLTLLGLNAKHEIAVLEMGMNGLGEIEKLSEIAKPSMGVMTNIGPSHLEGLKSLDNVFKAKAELIKKLPRNAPVFLNIDDEILRKARVSGRKKVYYGIERRCRFRAENVSYRAGAWSFTVSGERFELPLLGRHNIYNALIAIAVSRTLGVPLRDVKKGIAGFRPGRSGRLDRITVRGIDVIDDSYNSNPLSMASALDALGMYGVSGKKIVVCGDMLELGDKSRFFHEEAGRDVAERHIYSLITLGRLSRFIHKSAGRRGMENIYHAASHREAARVLRRLARPGDAILVKGSRGMKMEKVIEELEK